MQWAAGHSVGPYELVARIGAGGMGEVWKAHDARLNRSVAIKRLTAEHARRFASEARAIAALNHPNICQIHDVGSEIADTLSAVLRDEPRPLVAPGGLTTIVARCLRKSPTDRFATAGELRSALQALTGDRTALPSIVVLPFANMSRDPDDEYFGDGLAEEIINALAQIPGLKVIARTSAFAFKGQNTDIRRIAEALGVTTVLEGSVRRSGNRLRVTAQLITAADGTHLWSQRFDRELADIFDVQDEIAQAIAGALQVKLDLRAAAHTPGLLAYDAYLRGRHHLFKFNPESWSRAKECFEEATRLDAMWAQPLATLGLGNLLSQANGLEHLRVTAPRIRATAERALALDPSDPGPRFLLGSIAAAHDYGCAEALRQFRASFAVKTVSPDARWAYASLYLQPLGRCRESSGEMRLVVEQDPLNAAYRAILASHLVHAGLHDEAVREVQQAIDIDPAHFAARFILVEALMARGPIREAVAAAERAYDVAPWNGNIVGVLSGLLSQVGQAPRGEELMARLGARANPYSRVFFHVLRSEIDLAADWYEKAIEERELFAIICAPAPAILPLRESARWPRLAKLMNLPDS
jgi:TolB-like protein